MRINPIKLVKSISQTAVEVDDLLRRPSLPFKLPFFKRSEVAFNGKELVFGDKNVSHMIAEASREDPRLLAKIAGQLEDFKRAQLKRARKALKKGKIDPQVEEELATILALCEAYIARIGESMKNRYDETQSGLRLQFDEDGQLILNGMNVGAYVALCRDNPTPKSRIFLKGIRNRLTFILQNKGGSRNYERIREVVLGLFEEIDSILGTSRAVWQD